MSADSIKTIAVLGAGTMGNGIAHVFARSGYKVILRDVEQRFVGQVLSERSLQDEPAAGWAGGGKRSNLVGDGFGRCVPDVDPVMPRAGRSFAGSSAASSPAIGPSTASMSIASPPGCARR